MAFMDFHEHRSLSGEDIAQIGDDARNARADQFGVRQVELYHNADGKVYCLLEAPDEEAVRKHHAALGVDWAWTAARSTGSTALSKGRSRPGRRLRLPGRVRRRTAARSGGPLA
jgi:hypothetical protein